jgi:hypothetical protein
VTTTTERPNIQIRAEKWTELRQRHQLTMDTKLAEHMGTTAMNLWRVLTLRTQCPGNFFIAATLTAFPDCTFDDLFEIRP